MSILNFFILIGFIIGFSSPSLANDNTGLITLEGRASASHAPEFVSIDINITSICYNSSQEASQANAELASNVLAILQSFKKSDKDRVTATGGANFIQTETTQIGAEPKIICEMKWHAENHLRIEISSIDDLPRLQDQVLQAVNREDSVDPNQVAQTFAELARPEFQLYLTTAQKLRESAQVLAFDDAKSQLAALASRCDFKNLRLVKISPSEFSYVYKMGGERVSTHPASTPVIPDEMEVQAMLRMEWAFDPDSGCRFQ